jgi:predicted house-cleaning noncanonical NTP pyrophosphatase (MazG superfamily)
MKLAFLEIRHSARIETGDRLYASHLRAKLREKVDEFLESESVEELADILEVLDALALYHRIDPREIQRVKQRKYDQYGGFSVRVVLLEVDNNTPTPPPKGST